MRVSGSQIAERRLTDTSLMPTGLIDRASDRDIADLYAYLKNLRAVPPAPKGRRHPPGG